MEYSTKNRTPALIMLAFGVGYSIANILMGRFALTDYWMPIILVFIGLIYLVGCSDYLISQEMVKKTTVFGSECKSVSDIQQVFGNKVGSKYVSWRIRFKDGSDYTVEVPRFNHKAANKLNNILSGLT